MFGITVNVPGYYERLRGVGRVVVAVWKSFGLEPGVRLGWFRVRVMVRIWVIWIKATGRVRDSVKVRVI